MSIASYLLDPYTLTTGVLGLTTLYVVWFYQKVRKYPPGPTPLPLLGNLHQFLRAKNVQLLLEEYSRQHTDPFTFWTASTPTVCIMDPKNVEQCHLGPQRIHFAGRAQSTIGKLNTGGNDDIFFNNMDKPWDALRKVAIRAIRKYANSEALPEICAEVTKDYFEEAVEKGNEEADIVKMMEQIIEVVTTYTAFGIRKSRDDPEMLEMRRNIKELQEYAQYGLPSDIHPILGYLLFWRERYITRMIKKFVQYGYDMYDRAKSNYQPGHITNFTDALQAAKKEAEDDERSIAVYLTEGNLRQAIFLLFGAGQGGNRIASIWACAYLARYPEVQEELHKEIVEVVGEDHQISAEHRHSFPKLESFIAEVLRIKPPAPMVGLHKAMCDSEVAGRKIPSGTSLLISLETTIRNPKNYPEPDMFVPDRFTNKETGKFQMRRPPEYTVFGIGPRACPGEALAYAELVYIIANIVQRYEISGLQGPESVSFDLNPITRFGYDPKPQNLIIRRRSQK